MIRVGRVCRLKFFLMVAIGKIFPMRVGSISLQRLKNDG